MIRRIGYVLAILLGAGVSLVGPSVGATTVEQHSTARSAHPTAGTYKLRARRKPALHHRPTTRPQRLPLGNRLPRLVVGAERHGDYSIRRWRIGRQHFVLCEVRPASSLPLSTVWIGPRRPALGIGSQSSPGTTTSYVGSYPLSTTAFHAIRIGGIPRGLRSNKDD